MFRLLPALVVMYSVCCEERIYYEHNNMTCVMCPPGSHWVGHCLTNGASAACAPCQDNQYLPTYNRAIYCKQCRTSCWNQNHEEESVQREEIVQTCTRISDLKCQCKEGYWRKYGTNDVCLRVATCGQGKGIKTKATRNSDTVCEDCVHGETFSNVSSATEQCRPCSTCGADEIIQLSCTITKDTVCAVRTTTGRNELVMGLGIGIPVSVLVSVGVGIYVFFYCRRATTASAIKTKDDKVKLQVNVTSSHEVVNESEDQANGTAFPKITHHANRFAKHDVVDETEINGTVKREQSAQCKENYSREHKVQAIWVASQDTGALDNEITEHDSSEDHEHYAEEALVENGTKAIDDAYVGNGKAAFANHVKKKAVVPVKKHPSEAPDIELFMQRVYIDLSAEMDSGFRMFFRKIIRETTINVTGQEERKVCEQCYQLFRVWQNTQTDVRELPAIEIPFELIRRLTAMFWEDTDMNCKSKCIDILERYENSWKRQFIRK